MDDKTVIDRIINILDSEAQNLVKGNITSPKPSSLCQVTTDYGVKEAYNINCTYPGDAYVVWDKEEEKYYCFTDKPSEVISTKQLAYRKRRSTEKLLKPVYALVTKKYIELQPVNGLFAVGGSPGSATGTAANYSGAGIEYVQYIEDDSTFTYPSTLSGSISYSATISSTSASYCQASLSLTDVLINSKELLFTITGEVATTLAIPGLSDTGVSIIINLVGYQKSNEYQYTFAGGYGEGSSGVSETFVVYPDAPFSRLRMEIRLMFVHAVPPGSSLTRVVSCSLNYSFSGVEYEYPYNLLLHSSKSKKSLNIYDKAILPNKPVDCSITSLKNKILVNIKDTYTSRYERIIQRIYDYSLNLNEENIYIYDSNNLNNVPNNLDDWLNLYHKSYSVSPSLPEYISENLDFLSNLLKTILIQAIISDEDKKLIATQNMSIPVNYYDITTTNYTKKLKYSKILKLRQIEQAAIMALSIYKLL